MSGTFPGSDAAVYRFCHTCQVAWRGQPACWNCGQRTPRRRRDDLDRTARRDTR